MAQLGPKLQAVHQKVNTKLGRQDGPIVIRKSVRTPAAEFGKPYQSNTNTDVTLSEGVRVEWVRQYDTKDGGTYKEDDLKLYIPANLITEAQLTGTTVIYKGQTYNIMNVRPSETFSGVAVNWRVIARIKK